jgi:D-3-phosphoglycerate dehydrogenase
MHKIILSQRLRDCGMARLEGRAEYMIADSTDAGEYVEELQKADGLLIRLSRIGREEILACPNLKVIGRHGVGYDTVDVKAATEAGIPVVITPGANARSVAEHTVALMLALIKDLMNSHQEMMAGNWEIRQSFRSYEFEGTLVGFVGFGNIGREAARMCAALGFRVAAYDPFLKAEQIQELGYIPYENLDEMLAEADVLSIHVPYSEETKDMIGRRELSLMKNRAILINCARGGIVNERDLAEALREGVIGGAGLDVFEGEIPAADSPLRTAPNLICTPHMAAQTEKAVDAICRMMIEGCLAVMDGKKWPYVADKKVYEHPRWQGKPWYGEEDKNKKEGTN